ncbi:ATP-binding protein [Nonomuraea soli]|uniref:Anti-sigma regulatory factor (Ser/Thr protein kinase) n=1 Tax=Nonomuraea soli TaxID=1032476 RepID=A0A7W0HNP4_9ACTN|nr:ATP-binding protein [Nonomuraea soli]MBA2889766.1 anti-sigma regulatory factor (Ser/Thr protein kinase) [Nonomuraea soli]
MTGDRRAGDDTPSSREAGEPGSDGSRFAASFSRGRITAVRQAVSEQAAFRGLSGRALEDFVLAVNEIVTNAVVHGGGSGELLLWRQDGRVWCEVSDAGPGIPAAWIDRDRLPASFSGGGRGIWLIRRLCSQISFVTGPGGTGTIVRFAARSP